MMTLGCTDNFEMRVKDSWLVYKGSWRYMELSPNEFCL